ncbi:unannotated protein [freshwater metagenome]|uniref:Unannotated protein n=1 Tax=freshwater metagenome TaxID=449393 RepID=A0A6J6XAH7_9ZZZZ
MGPSNHHRPTNSGSIRHPFYFRERFGDSTIRNPHDRAEAFWRIRGEFRDPVVVGPYHRVVIVGIAIRSDCGRKPRSWVQHLGIDTVLIHFFDPCCRVVTPSPHIFETHPPRHLFRVETCTRIHPKIDGVVNAFDHPCIALFKPFHSRRSISHRSRNSSGPEVAGFVEMTICRNKPIAASSTW